MSNKSNVDVAYEIIASSDTPTAFVELWKKVVEVQGISEEAAAANVGSFYTSLLLDGRVICVGDNAWDLRNRYKFEDATLEINECYTEDDEDTDGDPEEEKENDGEDDEKEESEDGEESEDDESKSEYEGE